MSGPRVGIDAMAVRLGGGLTFLRALLPALARGWPAARLEVLARPEVAAVLSAEGGVRVEARAAPRGALRLPWERRAVPRWAREARLDVLLAAADAGPVRAPCPYVQVAQNAKIYAERGLRYRLLRRAARATAAGAAATVFVSEALARRAAPVLAPRTAATIPHGVDPAPPGPFPRPIEGAYVLVVATPYPHKDLALALEAVRALRARGRPERLVHVGHGGVGAVLEDLRRRAAADPEALVLVGEIARSALEPWYAHASALMLPSREESSGMPIAEALVRGVPVVASDAPALVETAGGLARHHPVGDLRAATLALEEALSRPAPKSARLESGAAYGAARTWQAAASRYREVLERALR